MCDQEQRVVDLEVDGRGGQHDARHSAEDEQHHEGERIDQRHGEADAAADMVRHPVIDLDAGRMPISIVAMPKAALMSALCPIVKKWCSQTTKDRTAIAIVAITSECSHRTLPEKVAITSNRRRRPAG